jgi:ribosomal-protein-alanine N-acetyltransferase
MLRIDGKRIYLRDHRASDLDVFHSWLSDPQVAHYLSWRTHTPEESLIALAESLQENDNPSRTKFHFAIVLSEVGVIIGDTGFTIEKRAEYRGVADLGYFLLKPYWGKGYASEAAHLILKYCFTVLRLHKVTAGCDTENRASEKVMIKCGMEREAYRKRHHFLNGEWRDRVEYAILYEDWIKHQNSSNQPAG